MNHYRALDLCLSTIFSENRFALFRIMLWLLRDVPLHLAPRGQRLPLGADRNEAGFAALIAAGLGQCEHGPMFVFLHSGSAPLDGSQLPSLEVVADLQAQRGLVRLIEKDPEAFIISRDRADQRQRRRLGRDPARWWRRGLADLGFRNDGGNTGRSRVLDSVVSGMPHNGLALSGRGVAAGDGATRTDVTDSEGGGEFNTGPPRRVSSSRPASSASPDRSGTAAGAA